MGKGVLHPNIWVVLESVVFRQRANADMGWNSQGKQHTNSFVELSCSHWTQSWWQEIGYFLRQIANADDCIQQGRANLLSEGSASNF